MKVIPLHKNESTLIREAGKNNRKAQHDLFNMFSSKMLSVCRYYISDIHKAEEVMLNGFFKVFTHIKRFEHKGSFEGWIRKIMIRESISFLRQQKEVEFFVENEDFVEEAYDSFNGDLDVEAIQQLIDNLPEGYKMVFILYAIEGYKHSEIANMLQISEGTSKSQLYKARTMLQKQINEINKTDYGTS